MVLFAGTQRVHALYRVLAGIAGDPRSITRLRMPAFDTWLDTALGRLGLASGCRAIALYGLRDPAAAHGSGWQAVGGWVSSDADRAVLEDSLPASGATAWRGDPQWLGMLEPGSTTTLATEFGGDAGARRFVVYVGADGAPIGALAFAVWDDDIPDVDEQRAFVDVARMVCVMRHEQLRRERRRRRHERRLELATQRRPVRALERQRVGALPGPRSPHPARERASDARSTERACDVRDAARAQELEKSFRERTAELGRANRALGQAIARLTTTGDLQSFLGSILAAAVDTAAATSGILYQREAGSTQYVAVAHLVRGELLDLTVADEHAAYRRPIGSDDPWFTAALGSDAVQIVDLAVDADRLPAFAALRARGYRHITFASLRDRGLPVGFLALGYAERGDEPPDPAKTELARLLAQQATLAARLAAVAAEWQKAAVARERDRLGRERLDELAFANQAISRSIARLCDGGDVEAFLASVLREIIGAAGAVSGTLHLHDAARDTLVARVVIERGETLDIERDPRGAIFRAPQPAAGNTLWAAMQLREPHWIEPPECLEDHCRAYGDWHAAQRHSVIGAIPMLEGDVPIGFVTFAYAENVERPPPVRFDLCRTLAQHGALAARLAQLAEQRRTTDVERERARAAEAQARELALANAALSRSGARLTDLDDLDGYLLSILQELVGAVGAVTGSVYLHDPVTDLLATRLVITHGRRVDFANEPVAAPFREPMRATGHPMWEALRRQEVYWWDYGSPSFRPGRFHEWDTAQGHRFAAAVPMLNGDMPIGFLGLGFGGEAAAPSPLRVELCRGLAQHAALATRLAALADRAREAAVFRERARFARDMHDTVAQGLTGIVLQLQAAEGPIPAAQRERFVRQAIELARASLIDARRAVHALRAERAGGADLGAALDASLKLLFANASTRVELEVTGQRRRLPDVIEDELLRIAQEAAVNVLKHAGAAEFGARLEFAPDRVRLRLEDDGRGFDASRVPEGFGLRGIRERADRLGAEFHLWSVAGAGTVLEVRVSLPSQEVA